MNQDPDSQIPGREPPAGTRWQPPSIEEVADAIAGIDRNIRRLDSPTPEQELGMMTAESLALIADNSRRIAEALEAEIPEPEPAPPEVLRAISAITHVVAAIDVRQRVVQDVAGDGLATGRRVDALAILDEGQVGQLVDAVGVLGPWTSEQMQQHLQAGSRRHREASDAATQ